MMVEDRHLNDESGIANPEKRDTLKKLAIGAYAMSITVMTVRVPFELPARWFPAGRVFSGRCWRPAVAVLSGVGFQNNR